MLKLLKYLKPYKLSAIFGLTFKFIESLLELFIPLTMAGIIEEAITKGDRGVMLSKGGLLLLIIAVCITLAVLGQYYATEASVKFGADLRSGLYRHINTLSYRNIDSMGTSSIINRLTYDTQQVQGAVFMTVRVAMRAPFMAIGSFLMAASMDLQISLIFLACIPLVALIMYLIMKRTVRMYKAVQKKLDGITVAARENISGARVVRAFSRQGHEDERFERISLEYKNEALKVNRLSALTSPLTSLVMQLGIAAILVAGGYRVYYGFLQPAQITAFITYILQVLLAMTVLANLIVTFLKASASGSRIQEIFMQKPALENGLLEAKADGGYAVEFENVNFSYSGKEVLSGISLKIGKGECRGIIGGTGSGKTTLVNLIPRFYDVSSGSVKVFGKNVKEYDEKSLRDIVGIVPQKSVLLSGTLRENMTMGRDIPEGEIIKALETSQSDFALKYPDGLNHIIERDGRNLSGGQKQRLAVARALSKRPKILILDDSSSALDYATDSALYNAVRVNYPDMTIITISQRVFSIKRSDVITVLEKGKTEGTGTHESLMQTCSVYAEIYNSQGA